ncbi:fungal-specific transcription factor [Niveomyces insectorum RCEF 264]|uniref:Fungal-specific transcription factor n=1 Tax=Niveomyces insectorum RCEF 264 TaxID=1081102 RepID=A0A167WEQ2_9HYPO|nr:fungal-specific transcription factor [Niveomyces insectorum RCEF 264]
MPSTDEARKTKRRVPPDKRRRTETSCDHCKAKKLKCRRRSSAEACLTCSASGRSCITTIPRKQRSYSRKGPSSSSSFLDAAAHDAGFQTGPPPSSLQIRPYLSSSSSPSRATAPRPPGHHRLLGLSSSGGGGSGGGGGGDAASDDVFFGGRGRSRSTPVVERLFDDDYGLPRYVGPTGSYTFMVKLREIMATKCAPKTAGLRYAQTMGHSIRLFDATGKTTADLPPKDVADAMVALFFAKVHRDFPIFHRALFMAMYEDMWSLTPNTEPAWLMALGMVFVLGLDAASSPPSSSSPSSRDDALPMLSPAQKRAMKERYLAAAKGLLPEVLSGCTLGHVQAIMLYCRHAYISGDRNTSWSLAGAAIRIAVAIGLHRNGANARCNLLERELRKRVWWTLYAFERMECSSLGRASAIDDDECNVGFPTEGLLDMGDIIPLGHLTAQSQLLRLLGSVCKQQYRLDSPCAAEPADGTGTDNDVAAALLEKLLAWHHNLPDHLRLDKGGVPSGPASHLRAITLLHIQYHYTMTLLCRPFLVAKATKSGPDRSAERNPDRHAFAPTSSFVTDLARRCMDSAKASIQLLQRLFLGGLFNPTTWWDVFFVKSSSMMLALGAIVDDAGFDPGREALGSIKICMSILAHCGEFSPTMKNFATVATDLGRAVILTEATDVTDVTDETEVTAATAATDATDASPETSGTSGTSGSNSTHTTSTPTDSEPGLPPPLDGAITSSAAAAFHPANGAAYDATFDVGAANTTANITTDAGSRVDDPLAAPFLDTYTQAHANAEASFLDAFPEEWNLTPEDWDVMEISRHLNWSDTQGWAPKQ